MIKRILLFVLLGTSPVLAQIAAIQGHSFLGGTQAVTSGLKSSNYMQGIVPYATICVYNTGTTAPATIYANASGAPLSSCFTSNASISTDPGGWIFWAATNQGYDVKGSGGIPPNAYPAPTPLCIDCFPSVEFVSSAGSGTPGYLPIWTGTTALGDSLADYGVTNAGEFTFGAPIVLGGIGVTTSPICPNGTGGALTTSGCASGGTSIPNIIYDDDCANDADCAVTTMPALARWYNTGQVNILALINDVSNAYAAPAESVLAHFYGMGNIPMGAWLGAVPSSNTTGNTSTWTNPLVTQFNSGDINTNYTSCVTVYRQVLAAAQPSSVKMVSTGFLTCIDALMQSSADSIISLTGAQLIKAKVYELDVVGGYEPSTGSSDFNFQQDAVSAQYVLANWTTANGYPPIYFSGVNNGAMSVISGVSSGYPNTDPSSYVGSITSYTRPSWDALALYQAIFGTAGLSTVSGNGTNTVTATSGGSAGLNVYATSPASGHYYLTLSQAASFYEYLLNAMIAAQGEGGVSVNSINSLAGNPIIVGGAGCTVTTSSPEISISCSGSTGLSGMSSGQVPIAATATTVTSSKGLAGSGAGITTGPTSATSGNCAEFTGSGGQLADAGSPCGSGGSGALKQIAQTVVSGSSTTSITFSGIPSTYTQLELVLNVQSSDTSADTLNMQFNGDTGSNYDYSSVFMLAPTAVSAAASAAQTSIGLSGGTPNVSSRSLSMTCYVPSYAGTTFYPNISCTSTGWTTYLQNVSVSGAWRSTAGITSLNLFFGSGDNFLAGSTATLYGVQ